ncbi:MAG: sulfotransferase [Chloroflexaceae bacterium]|nr:sulfotransferase [Chloroflexaceae bacterium]
MVNSQWRDRVQRALMRATLSPVLKAWGRLQSRTYDINNTLLVASSPRGGSTWLAEILGSLPGYPILFEPLNRSRNPNCQRYGLPNFYIDETQDCQPYQTYFRQVFRGENLSARLVLLEEFRLSQYRHFRGYIVKFIRLNPILPWVLGQFPLRAVLLLRHPCATVASQLHHPYWSFIHERGDFAAWLETPLAFQRAEPLLQRHPHLRRVSQQIRTPEAWLAFHWAIENYFPLSQPQPHPWQLVIYERLVRDGPAEIRRLFGALGEPVPPGGLPALADSQHHRPGQLWH